MLRSENLGGILRNIRDDMQQPTPFDEDKDPNPFWKTMYEDPFDKFIYKGLISDIVYFFRGTEVPTVYAIWGALSAVSAVIKREAWIQWYPGRFYANLYTILIGPAGGKKTTMVDFVIDLLQDYHQYIEREDWRTIKQVNIIKNKATPEGILEAMMPTGEIPVDGDEPNTFKYIDKGSEMFIGLTEMSVMLNKQQYNESMIQNLLDLYDCHGTWMWTTKGDKQRVLKNLHTTLLGATTPAGFKDSVPSEAVGDGFLSRTIIANSGFSDREFAMPQCPVNAPTKEVLMQRLAYIAQAIQGTYTLTDEAVQFFRDWYHRFKCELKESGEDLGIMSRHNIHLLKVALLLHAQSYPHPSDKTITRETLEAAQQLISATYVTSYSAVNEVKHRGEFADIYKVRDYIQARGKVVRKNLQASLRMPAKRLDKVLQYLLGQHDIEVRTSDKEKIKHIRRKSDDIYKFIGDTALEGDYTTKVIKEGIDG
jgi:hypothetical protein